MPTAFSLGRSEAKLATTALSRLSLAKSPSTLSKVAGHHELGAAVAGLVLDLLLAVQGIEVDDCAARLEDPVIENDEGRAVGHQQPNLHALADPECLEALGCLIRQSADFGKAQPLAHEMGAGARAVGDDGVVEQACEQGRPDFHAPVVVLGVAFERGKIPAGDLSASQRTRWG